MTLGPVDVSIVAFPGNHFNGEIVPTILEQVERGVIRILDVLFVRKDADGTVTTLVVADLGAAGAQFAALESFTPGALDADDALEVADDIEPNSSVLLIAYEHAWLREVIGAFNRAGAVPIDHIRIPAHVVNAIAGQPS